MSTDASAESVVVLPLETRFGASLVGRAAGEVARRAVEDAAASGGTVIVDVSGVHTMSGSYADELFGRLDPGLVAAGRVRFAGVPENIELLAQYVRQNRERLGRRS
jgi:hypothetical protein